MSDNKAVVQVIGWSNDKNLGSALAEGSTVEQAEDKAIARLSKRLNSTYKKESNINSNIDNKLKTVFNDEFINSEKPKTIPLRGYLANEMCTFLL